MVRQAKDKLPSQLAAGQLTLDEWDARRTEDGRISVIDVIADVTGKTHQYAINVYNRLCNEQRVSQRELRPLPPRSNLSVTPESFNTQRRSGGFSWAAQTSPRQSHPLRATDIEFETGGLFTVP